MRLCLSPLSGIGLPVRIAPLLLRESAIKEWLRPEPAGFRPQSSCGAAEQDRMIEGARGKAMKARARACPSDAARAETSAHSLAIRLTSCLLLALPLPPCLLSQVLELLPSLWSEHCLNSGTKRPLR